MANSLTQEYNSVKIEPMITDPVDDFRMRVAKHAALADPARLRIVDLLTLGDISPTELQAELGMPSNLLSHHLRTLEGAGLATRHRSEGDKRRSYIRLAAGALDGLAPGREHGARRVLFVCTRNGARSQLAAALWNRASEIPSISAGTHPADRIATGAIDVARRHGVALADVPPRRLDDVVHDDDFVVTVCDNAHEELPGLVGIHWSIPDPLRRNTDDAFEEAFADIDRRISGLAPRLHAA
jgi:protein-tyrosine-phosphatase